MYSAPLLLGLLGLTACVSSLTIHPRVSFSPPGPTDQRSPCPALNTLANHGIINHSGQNFKADDVINALQAVYNLAPAVAKTLTHAAIFLTGDILSQTFSLGALAGSTTVSGLSTHNKIEHDASLTRQDTAFGDSHDLDPGLYSELKQLANGGDITIDVLSLHRLNRYNHSATNNPSFTFGPIQWFTAYGEVALALMSFGGDAQSVSQDVMDSFFLRQQIPDGYQKPSTPVTSTGMNKIIFSAYNKNPTPIQGLPAPKTMDEMACFIVRSSGLASFGPKLLQYLSDKTGIPIPSDC